MNVRRAAWLAGILLFSAGCRHHALTPRIGGRPAQTLEAEARKVDGRWVVTMPLPLESWTPKAVGEEQPMEVVVVDGRSAVQWKVAPARWAQSERPFAFVLVGPEDRTLEMSVNYTLFSRGAQFWLHVLTWGRWFPVPLRAS